MLSPRLRSRYAPSNVLSGEVQNAFTRRQSTQDRILEEHLKIDRLSRSCHLPFTQGSHPVINSIPRTPCVTPISAGTSDHMTTDIAAGGDPGVPARHSALDESNLGLFPQLIDVIRAMTEGQELLSHKLRTVRLMHPGPWTPEDDPLQEVLWDGVGLLSSNDAAPRAVRGTAPVPPRTPSDQGGNSTTPNELRKTSASEPIHVAPAAAQAARGEVDKELTRTSTTGAALLPPIKEPEIRGRHARRQSQPLLASEGLGAPPVTATRDYNFFDELDARLADLQDSDESLA